MATKKDIEEVAAEEAAPVVVTPAPKAARKVELPTEFSNTTFAERAKAQGRNKRVDASESK